MESSNVVEMGGALAVVESSALVARRVNSKPETSSKRGITKYKTNAGVVRYLAQVRLKGRPAQSKAFDTFKEADDWKKACEVEAAKSNGKREAAVPSKLTLGEMLPMYVTECETRGKPMSYSKQRHYARLAAHSALKGVLVANVSTDVMRDYCEARVNVDGVKPSTTLSEFAYVKVAIKRMARWLKWGAFAPLEGGRETLREENLVAESTERTRRPSAKEMDMLLPYFRAQEQARRGNKRYVQIPMADIVEFASLNAFRRGEITELEWADLDLEHSTIGCSRKYSAAKDGSGKRWTDVPLLPAALDIIMRQPRNQNEPRIFPYSADTVSDRFTEACFALGINTEDMHDDDKLTFHDLRHEAITTAAKTLSLAEGMALSGHKTPKHFTRYVNMAKEDLAAISGKLAAVRVKSAVAA